MNEKIGKIRTSGTKNYCAKKAPLIVISPIAVCWSRILAYLPTLISLPNTSLSAPVAASLIFPLDTHSVPSSKDCSINPVQLLVDAFT